MTQRHDAIAYYNELCTEGSLAQDTWTMLLPGLRARGLIFGERPLTTVLRPLFHAGMDWHYLRWRSTIVLGVFVICIAVLLIGLISLIIRLVRIPPNNDTERA